MGQTIACNNEYSCNELHCAPSPRPIQSIQAMDCPDPIPFTCSLVQLKALVWARHQQRHQLKLRNQKLLLATLHRGQFLAGARPALSLLDQFSFLSLLMNWTFEL